MFREGMPVSEHGRGVGKARTQETERVTKLKIRLHLLPFASPAQTNLGQPVLSVVTGFSLSIHTNNM